MKKYLVTVKTVSFPTIEIEANSEDEAFEKASGIDGGDFEIDYDGTWELIKAEEIK